MLEHARDVEHVRQRLIEDSPPGLEITSVTELEPNERKAQVKSVTYEITVPPVRQEALRSADEQTARAANLPRVPRRPNPTD